MKQHTATSPPPDAEEPSPASAETGADEGADGDGDVRASGERPIQVTTEDAYRRYAQRLLRRIRARNVGPESAKELLHDVYVVVLQVSHRQKPLINTLATLLAITRRVLANYLRRRQHRARPGWEGDAAEMADTTSCPDDDAEDARLLLETAFKRMRPGDVALIRQLKIDEIPAAEIARSLGCPVKTFWTRYNRAKQRLVEQLALIDDEPPLPALPPHIRGS